jgi:hypothetical protein
LFGQRDSIASLWKKHRLRALANGLRQVSSQAPFQQRYQLFKTRSSNWWLSLLSDCALSAQKLLATLIRDKRKPFYFQAKEVPMASCIK